MKNKKIFWSLLPMALFISACSTRPQVISDGDMRAVGNVQWHKSTTLSPDALLNQAIPANSASIFFFRDDTEANANTSANISINERFQTSLQPNHFSQVYTCAGINRIGGEITGMRTNNLLANVQDYHLENGQIYFFRVSVDEAGQVHIVPTQRDDQVTQTHQMQAHQISRVVPNCQSETPSVERINLAVYFDTDKATIKPRYYSEIERVANYMNTYPNTRVEIEGHTDNRASDVYNKQLSQRRVDAVKQVLVSRYKIAADRIHAIGYGESRPVASNNTAEGRAQNRRVVAVFYNN